MENLFSIGLCLRRCSPHVASTFRCSRSRITHSATDMVVLIDG